MRRFISNEVSAMHEHKTPNRAPRERRQNQKLLTIAQVAIETGILGTSLRDLVLRGELPAIRFNQSRRLWIRRVDIDRLIERSVEHVSA